MEAKDKINRDGDRSKVKNIIKSKIKKSLQLQKDLSTWATKSFIKYLNEQRVF